MTDDILTSPRRADEAEIQALRDRLAHIAGECGEAAVEAAVLASERRAMPDDLPIATFGRTLAALDRSWLSYTRARLDGGRAANKIVRQAATDSAGELIAEAIVRILTQLREERWARVAAEVGSMRG